MPLTGCSQSSDPNKGCDASDDATGTTTPCSIDPEIISCNWVDSINKNVLTDAAVDDSVGILIKFNDSNAISDGTEVEIKIFEWDPTWFDPDEPIDTIDAIIKDKEAFTTYKITKFDNESDIIDELYFKISVVIDGKTISKECPEETADYLQVKTYKIAIAGNDADSKADRKSLRDSADYFRNFGYFVSSNTIETGTKFIEELTNFKHTPIKSIFISAHGCPYAIDFQTSGSNLYISQTNVEQIVQMSFPSWSPTSDARYISDIADLVSSGTLANDVEIIISACLCGSDPTIVQSIPGTPQFNLDWAQINSGKVIYENFAQQLSLAIPKATVVASTRRVDSGKGISNGCLIIYKGGTIVKDNTLEKYHYNMISQYKNR